MNTGLRIDDVYLYKADIRIFKKWPFSYIFLLLNIHIKRHQGTSTKLWFERLKIINLPRELVIMDAGK